MRATFWRKALHSPSRSSKTKAIRQIPLHSSPERLPLILRHNPERIIVLFESLILSHNWSIVGRSTGAGTELVAKDNAMSALNNDLCA